MQRITTREPDDAQLEVALLSLQYALTEDFPELDRAALRATVADKKARKTEDAPASTEDAPASTEDAPASATPRDGAEGSEP
jgi:hypothetical protein